MIKYYLAALAGVFLTTIAQLVLKKGALVGVKKQGFFQSFFNLYSIIGYALFVLVTLFNLYALKIVKLKEMTVILPIPFVLVPILSMVIFKEKLSRLQFYGIAFIMVGVVVFNLDVLIN